MDLEDFKNINIDKSDWQPVKFGDVVREIRESVKDPASQGIDRIVGLEHLETENIHLRNWDSIVKGTTFTRRFRKGQVLFGRRRAYLKKAALAEFDGVCSGDIIVMEAKENLNPKLLPFIVNNDNFFDFAVKTSAGSLSPRTKFQYLVEYEFLLPPKDQQEKIAELLWAANELFEKYFSMQYTLTNYLFGYRKSVFDNEEMTSKNLGDICKVIMGQSPPGKSYNTQQKGMPFLQGNADFGEVFPKITKYTTEPKRVAPEGSILLSVRAPVGDLNITNQDLCIGRGLAAIIVQNGITINYLFNYLDHAKSELHKISTGSTFKAINKVALNSFPIKFTTSEKTKEIDNEFENISKQLIFLKNTNNKYSLLKKSFIEKIF